MVGFIRIRRWEIRLHVKASKSQIIVKEKFQDKTKQIFQPSKITITTQGHRHLVWLFEVKHSKKVT